MNERKLYTRLNSKKVPNIIDAYKKGEAASTIADKLAINISQVYYVLRNNDIQRRSRGCPKGFFSSSGRKKIPFEDIPSVIRRYIAKKESITSIAKDYGVSRQAIDGLLKTRSIHRDKIPFRKIQPEAFPMVIKKFHEYKNISRVAKDFSVAPGVIVSVLKSQNIKHDQYAHRLDLSSKQIKRIIARYQKGNFAKDIAKGYGLQPYSVWSILHRNNVRRGESKPKKFPLSQYLRFQKAYQRGLTPQDLAQKYNLSVGGVSLILKRIQKGVGVSA